MQLSFIFSTCPNSFAEDGNGNTYSVVRVLDQLFRLKNLYREDRAFYSTTVGFAYAILGNGKCGTVADQKLAALILLCNHCIVRRGIRKMETMMLAARKEVKDVGQLWLHQHSRWTLDVSTRDEKVTTSLTINELDHLIRWDSKLVS